MIAAAATIAVVYPRMNGIGGDSFWRHPDGMLEGASDPRSDGGVAGYWPANDASAVQCRANYERIL